MTLESTNPQGVKFLCIVWIFTSLSFASLCLRLVARRVTRAGVVFSDYAIVVSQFCATGYSIAGTLAVVPGHEGLLYDDLPPEDVAFYGKSMMAQQYLWLIGNSLVKLSILHFLYTLFHRKPSFSKYVYTLMVLVAASGLAFFIAGFFACTPVAAQWDYTLLHGNCSLRTPIWLSSAVFSLILDLCIFILPLPVIWGLQMPRARKLCVVGVFGVGAVVCAIAATRIVYISGASSSDQGFSGSMIGIWSILDLTLGVMNACLPLFPPALCHLAGRDLFAWTRRTLPDPYHDGYNHSSTFSSRHDDVSAPMRHADSHSSQDSASLWEDGTHGRPVGNAEYPILPTKGFGSARKDRVSISSKLFVPPQLRSIDNTRYISASGKGPSGPYSPSILASTAPHSRVLSRDVSRCETSRCESRITNPERRTSIAAAYLQQPAAPAPVHRRESVGANGRAIANMITSRVASRMGSRTGSRMGSRAGSRPGSRTGWRADEEGGLVEMHRRRSSEGNWAEVAGAVALEHGGEGREIDELDKGITVTTTWGVEVESIDDGERTSCSCVREDEMETHT